MKKLFALILIAALLTGCDWSWGTPIDETDEADETVVEDSVQLDDLTVSRMDATVDMVFSTSAMVETPHGLKFDVSIPDGETVAVGDAVEIVLTFEGNQSENQWYLVDVVFDLIATE